MTNAEKMVLTLCTWLIQVGTLGEQDLRALVKMIPKKKRKKKKP